MSVKLQTKNGEDIMCSRLSIVESVDKYFSVVRVNAVGKLDDEIVLKFNSSTISLVLTNSVYNEGSGFEMEYTSKDVFSLISSTVSEFTGECDAKQLLSKLGVPADIKESFTSQFWIVERCSMKYLMQLLSNYAAPASGGAPFFYISLDGKVKFLDPISAASGKAEALQGTVGQDYENRDFILTYHGVVNMLVQSSSKSSWNKLTIDKDKGEGNFIVNDTTGKSEQVWKQYFTNRYNHSGVASRKIRIRLNVPYAPPIGKVVNIQNTKLEGVVTGYEVSVNPVNGLGETVVDVFVPWQK